MVEFFPALQKPDTVVEACNLKLTYLEKIGKLEIQGHSQLCSEFQASMGWITLCLQTATKFKIIHTVDQISKTLSQNKHYLLLA